MGKAVAGRGHACASTHIPHAWLMLQVLRLECATPDHTPEGHTPDQPTEEVSGRCEAFAGATVALRSPGHV